MLGFTYLDSDQIKENKQMVQEYLDEEGSSPFIKSGRALHDLLPYLPEDREARILGLGPGVGSFLESLAKEGYHNLYAAGIDNYLHFTGVREFRAVDFSFGKLPWPAGFFDAVLCFETIEHLENPYHLVREVRRVLNASQGVFAVSIPNVQHIFNRILFLRKGDMPRWRKNNNHLGIFPRGVFAKLFLRHFSIVHRGFFWGFFPWRFLSKLSIFPETELFAHTVFYIFKSREQ